MTKERLDFPFYDVAKTAKEAIKSGGTVHQKWTCEHCGVRQTMEQPNTMFKSGKCEECGKVTNIETRGCNYLVHFGG